MKFAHLHVHSNYSFCRGTASIENLCSVAKMKGFSHLALTDTNGLYGLGWFLQFARSYQLTPIIGAFLQKDDIEAVVLAKNQDGYRFLCQTITKIHCDENFDLAAHLILNRNNGVLMSKCLKL